MQKNKIIFSQYWTNKIRSESGIKILLGKISNIFLTPKLYAVQWLENIISNNVYKIRLDLLFSLFSYYFLTCSFRRPVTFGFHSATKCCSSLVSTSHSPNIIHFNEIKLVSIRFLSTVFVYSISFAHCYWLCLHFYLSMYEYN